MSSAGTRERERYLANMARIQPGAVLAHRARHWTVTKLRRTETGVMLTLICGRRSVKAYIGVCHTGPDLWQSGLRVVTPPPASREMFRAYRGAA